MHSLTGDILRLYSFNSMFWLKRVWGFSFLISNYTWEFRSNSRTHCQTFTEFLPLSFFPILIFKTLLLSVDIWWTHSIILYLCWVIIFMGLHCKLQVNTLSFRKILRKLGRRRQSFLLNLCKYVSISSCDTVTI